MGIAVVGWLLGNGAWSITILILARFVEDTAMIAIISAVGFFILIVIGVVGSGWYLLRERPAPTSALENMARWVTAMYFAQRYEVSPEALLDLSTPQAMEERARRLQIEKQLPKSD
tara:strand:- start:24374 stop:24721 length:348 start_codon:yes stop_codon:yes gene_type:complete